MPDLKRAQFEANGQKISIAVDLHDLIITVTDRDGVSADYKTDGPTAHAIANVIHLQAVCAEANK